MSNEVMTKKDCDKLLIYCYREVLHPDASETYKGLKNFINEKILNKSIPFNDKDLFVDLFKYFVSKINSISKLYLIYDHMDEIYKELDLDNEYSKKIYVCIFKIFSSSLIYDINDIKRLMFLFKDKKYLSYLLTYLVNNFNSFVELNLEEYLTILIDIRDKFVSEEEFYKTSIYVLIEIKKCKYFNDNPILSNYLDSIYKNTLFNDNKLIDEYNNQNLIKNNIKEEIKRADIDTKKLSDRNSESMQVILKEIENINVYLNDKEKELLISNLEKGLIDLNFHNLFIDIIHNTKICYFIDGIILLEMFLLEDKINVITYCDAEYEYHLLKLFSDLKLNFISYNYSNISDFFNDDTLNVITSGGVLYFNFSQIDKEKQEEIIDKINYIKNKFYYNNNFYEVSKTLKIIVMSWEECNLDNFTKLDFNCLRKRRIR